jgi:hypothetical protein
MQMETTHHQSVARLLSRSFDALRGGDAPAAVTHLLKYSLSLLFRAEPHRELSQ